MAIIVRSAFVGFGRSQLFGKTIGLKLLLHRRNISSKGMSLFASAPTEVELSQIVHNLDQVNSRIRDVVTALGRSPVKLVAVSKTKPPACILELYKAGHRDFGENYVQELVAKAADLPKDINWYFIGHLQSGKAKGLLKDVPNLHCIETIDSEKIASKINAGIESGSRPPLEVLIQVHTSSEETKSGVAPSEVVGLADFIINSCPQLQLKGLMTIGAPEDPSCFDILQQCRTSLSQHLNVDPSTLELSMGMSSDFEAAIAHGSTSVRVGSTIFGARDYSK